MHEATRVHRGVMTRVLTGLVPNIETTVGPGKDHGIFPNLYVKTMAEAGQKKGASGRRALRVTAEANESEAEADAEGREDPTFQAPESVAEAEAEIGISEWIDPDTGVPAEESVPRIEDH